MLLLFFKTILNYDWALKKKKKKKKKKNNLGPYLIWKKPIQLMIKLFFFFFFFSTNLSLRLYSTGKNRFRL